MRLAPRPFGDALARGQLADLWRGILCAGFVYYGQCAGGGAARLARFGRAISRPHGWHEPAPAQAAGSVSTAAENAMYAGIRGLVRRNGAQFELSPAAVASLRKANALAPDQPWTWTTLGVALYLARDFSGAAAAFARAMELDPAWLWPALLRADSLHFDGRLPDGRAEFERVAALHPGSAWAWGLLARSHYLAGDPRMAGDLDRAIALEPRSGWLYTWRGAARQRLGDPAGAEKDYREALRLAPDYERTYAWYGAFLVHNERPAEGVRFLKRAARLLPHSEITYQELANGWAALGRPSLARKALERAIHLTWELAWVLGYSDVFWSDERSFKAVIRQIDRELAASPRWALGWSWRAQTLMRMGRLEEAKENADRALALNSRHAWTWVWRGEARRRLGQWSEAESDFTRALALDRRCGWAWLARGAARLALGRPREAKADLDRGLALTPAAGRGVGYGWRGQAWLALKRPKNAKDDLAEAARRHPDFKRRLAFGPMAPLRDQPSSNPGFAR